MKCEKLSHRISVPHKPKRIAHYYSLELAKLSPSINRPDIARPKSNYWNQQQRYTTPEVRYRSYRRGAKQRSISFFLTFDQFMTFWGQECYYCHSDMQGLIGLDRLDSNQGYQLDNLVSSCKTCNRLKSDLPSTHYIEHCKKVAAVHS